MPQDTKHWFKNPNTSWNLRRKDSEWHFDPTLNDIFRDNFAILPV